MAHNTTPSFLRNLGINITIKDIAEGYSKEKVRSSSLIKHLQAVYDQQVAAEDFILRDERWYPPMPNHTPELIGFDQVEKYVSKKNDKILNGRALEVLSCVANNIISADKSAASTARAHISLFRKYLTDVRLIGAPSERGYAMSAGLVDRIDNAFVIKVEREGHSAFSRYTMRHEVVVGLILNTLRPIIPNFAYVFGSFECGGPILTIRDSRLRDSALTESHGAVEAIDPKENMEPKVESWCRGGEIQTYAIYENINKSITLKDYVKTCTAQQYMDILIQIMFALKVAYERVGFTHYDLHYENILIRSYDTEGFYIPYEEYYVAASRIATIIDYGMSHVNYYNPESGRTISLGIKEPDGAAGNVSMLQYGVYMDKPNPIIDCYKILWYTLQTMSRYNLNVYKEMRDLIRFFHKDDSFETIFVSHPKHVYGFVPSFGTKVLIEQSSKFNYTDFIYFCREYCNYKKLEDPVFRADDLPEDSKDLVMLFKSPGFNNPFFADEIDDTDINTAEDLFDLFEPIALKAMDIRERIAKTSSDSQKKKFNDVLTDLTNSFLKLKKRYSSSAKDLLDEFINYTNTQISNVRSIDYMRIPERNPMVIFEPEIFMKLNTQLRTVSLHLDLLDSLENNFEIIENLKLFFDLDANSASADAVSFRAKDSRPKLKSFVTFDLSLLKRNFKDFDLDKFTALGELLLHGYSNMF